MKKFLPVVFLALMSHSVFAEPLKFTLDCSPDKGVARVPAHIEAYKLVKTPFRRDDGRWDAKYSVEVYFKSAPTKAYDYALTPAGSGDEDYLEYSLKGSDGQQKTINVQGAYIQNRFEWATLVDTNGYGFANCRKRR